MTTATLTLTDFLLARIAEDEATILGAVRVEELPPGLSNHERAKLSWAKWQDFETRVPSVALEFACPTCEVSPGEGCLAMTAPRHAPQPADSMHGQRRALARAEISRRATTAALVRFADPARLLRECKAKRQIVEAAAHAAAWPVGTSGDMHTGVEMAWWDAARTLAIVYSDHPDYDEAWR